MSIKVSKISTCEVSIPLYDAAELIRHELNSHGSREAGANVSIPPKAAVTIERGRDNNGATSADTLIFRWEEKA